MQFDSPAEYIPFSPPFLGEEEEREVVETLRSGWITTGPRSKEFEKKICGYIGADYGVGTFACTSAMQIALSVLGVEEDDEIITSPYTFVSTAHVICYHRAKPVFADVDPDTFNIDPARIEEKITSKTKGIIPVHFAGHSCDMDPIMDIAGKHGLFVMEDAAHAIGAEYRGKKIGTIGDITCFSFYATKNLSTAEGGMAVTNNQELADRMRVLTMYGISDSREIWHKRYSKAGSIHYDVAELGYKCNMTDITAALGLRQLDRLEDFIETREAYSRIYDQAFHNHPALQVPVIKDYTRHARHLYPLLIDLKYIAIDRDTFVDSLKQLNIGTSVLFMPLHYFTYYEKLLGNQRGDFPVAEDLFDRVICLPISPRLGEEEIRKVAEGLLYLLEKNKR